MKIEEYLDNLEGITERVETLAREHGEECSCKVCAVAWAVFCAIMDNPPAELDALLGKEA